MGKELRKVPELKLLDYAHGDDNHKTKFINDLHFGLKEYGFIVLVDHLVDQKIVDKAYELFMDFYSLPTKDKLEYSKPELKNQRGYIPFGLEKAVGQDVPDLKEFFHVGRPIESRHRFEKYYPNNIWLKELKNLEKLPLSYTAPWTPHLNFCSRQ